MNKIKVAVLMGGCSSERAVSLATGKMILDALDRSKYDAFAVDAALFGTNSAPRIEAGDETRIAVLSQVEQALRERGGMRAMTDLLDCKSPETHPDVAFIALHGKYGEDGTVQGLLELAGIPYTGSGVLASALAMDKIMAKKALEYAGVPVVPGVNIESRAELKERNIPTEVERELRYPVIVKPNRQGSTIGMNKVDSAEGLAAALETAFNYDSQVMVEKFVSGTEVTASVLGNDELEVLPLIEIVPLGGFYDYEAKYKPGRTKEIVPARVSEEVAEEARRLAVDSHKALGCRGMSRTDMIVSGVLTYVLELNTIPGMTRTSLLPTAAEAAGISFPELLDKLIGFALEGK